MYVVLKSCKKKFIIEIPESFSSDLEIIQIQSQPELENYLNSEESDATLKICDLSRTETLRSQGNKLMPDSIFVLKNESYRKIHFSQIMWIEASRSYSYIHVAGEQPVVVTFPLSEAEKKLPKPLFLRIHRSYIVNIDYVDAFIRNTLYIGNKSFPISKNYQKEVLSQFLVLGNYNEKRRKEAKEL